MISQSFIDELLKRSGEEETKWLGRDDGSLMSEDGQVIDAEKGNGNSNEDGDPPTSIKDWFKSIFNFFVKNEDEYEERETNRKFFKESIEKANEAGYKYIEVGLIIITAPVGGAEIQAERVVVKGFTKHGLNQIIERGIKPNQILEALKNGEKTIQTIKNQKQVKIIYKETTVIVSAAGRNIGKIITAYLNDMINKIDFSKLNDILSEWNPIGVPSDISKSEYTYYVKGLYKYINDFLGLVDYLELIIVEEIGLVYDSNDSNQKKEVLFYAYKIYQVLGSISD